MGGGSGLYFVISQFLCIPESFHMSISHQLFDYKITCVNSQYKNTKFSTQNRFQTVMVKISDMKTKKKIDRKKSGGFRPIFCYFQFLCISESFDTCISHQLFDHKITKITHEHEFQR